MATIKIDKHLTAFLDLIAASEGTSSHSGTRADGYNVIVSGVDGSHLFTDFTTHPFAHGRNPIVVRNEVLAVYASPGDDESTQRKLIHPGCSALKSTASGRYQFILETWNELAAECKLTSFTPSNQDNAAMEIIFTHHADKLILSNDIESAIYTLSKIWASFPGNLYGQGGKSILWQLNTYDVLLAGQSA